MKKILFICVVGSLLLSVTSCKKVKSIDELISEDSKNTLVEGLGKPVNLDMSSMNFNMISSVTFEMMVAPEKYVGKRVKIKGNFHTSVYEGQRYFSVFVWDPSGCCPAGLDFIPPSDMNFPDDFPMIDEKITVTGLLKYMGEGDQEYLAFQAEEVLWNSISNL